MIAASVIHPGVYFAMNSGAGLIGTDAGARGAGDLGWGFAVTPEMLTQIAHDVGETTILSRTGGAPTLAVGMATILSGFLGGKALAGDLVSLRHPVRGAVHPHHGRCRDAGLSFHDPGPGRQRGAGVQGDRIVDQQPCRVGVRLRCCGATSSTRACIDPLGGIWTLWPLFGTANQMLAAIALTLCTVVLFKMKRERFAWVTHRADRLAGGLHGDRRSGEGVQPEPGDRLPCPCDAVRQRDGGRDIARSGEDDAPDESDRVQRLCRCDAGGVFAAIVVAMVVYGVIGVRKALQQRKARPSKSAARRRRRNQRGAEVRQATNGGMSLLWARAPSGCRQRSARAAPDAPASQRFQDRVRCCRDTSRVAIWSGDNAS